MFKSFYSSVAFVLYISVVFLSNDILETYTKAKEKKEKEKEKVCESSRPHHYPTFHVVATMFLTFSVDIKCLQQQYVSSKRRGFKMIIKG